MSRSPYSFFWTAFWMAVVFAIATGIFSLAYLISAGAHDPARPDLDLWFRQQYSTKGPCCDGAEAHHISDVDWDSICVEGKCHYRVRLYNKWWTVDDGAVVEGPNLFGSTLVWAVPTRDNNEVVSVFIRCFMPGAGG